MFPGMIMWAANPPRGPASPPADYTVRITANGETKSQGFVIGIDKRLEGQVTVADLQEQFKLSSQIKTRSPRRTWP